MNTCKQLYVFLSLADRVVRHLLRWIWQKDWCEFHTTKCRDKNAEVQDSLCMEAQLFGQDVVWSTHEPLKHVLIVWSKTIRCDDKQTDHWLTFRHRASCILGQAFHYSPENAFYIFNQQIYFIIYLIFAWPCIIDINNIDNQLDATITAY